MIVSKLTVYPLYLPHSCLVSLVLSCTPGPQFGPSAWGCPSSISATSRSNSNTFLSAWDFLSSVLQVPFSKSALYLIRCVQDCSSLEMNGSVVDGPCLVDPGTASSTLSIRRKKNCELSSCIHSASLFQAKDRATWQRLHVLAFPILALVLSLSSGQ